MAQDYPSLALSDIVHIMSPSPVPQPSLDDSHLLRQKSTTPEPLQESEVQNIRTRITDMGFSGSDQVNASSREKELLDMIMRLTNAVRLDPEQLMRQANTISRLTEQRNYLVYQAEEQRLRWESEKDGWARMAEALISQQNKNSGSIYREEDTERQKAGFEADNKALRQKLNETQSRLASLEAELGRLRPLLLMQPTVVDQPSSQIGQERSRPSRRRRKDFISLIAEDEDQHMSDDEVDELVEDNDASTQNNTPKRRFRKQELQSTATSSRRKASLKNSSRPIYSDARAEHLLLAARKIGKQRAGIMSGIVHHVDAKDREKDRGRDKRREDMSTATTSPKTPRRAIAPAAHPVSAHMQAGGYVYMNSPLHHQSTAAAPIPVLVPVPHGSFHLLQTPSSSTTAASSSRHKLFSEPRSQRKAPQTPLDSLLSAARSMMDDEEESIGSTATNGSVRRMRELSSHDIPESPLPKRRKIAPALLQRVEKNDILGEQTPSSGGVARVRSALDVLADQAAAFSSNDPQPSKEKGKERGILSPDTQDAPELPVDSIASAKLLHKERRVRRDDTPPEGVSSISAGPSSPSRTLENELNLMESWASTPSNLRPVLRWDERSKSPPLVDPGGKNSPVVVTRSHLAGEAVSSAEVDHVDSRKDSDMRDAQIDVPPSELPQEAEILPLCVPVDTFSPPLVTSRAHSEDRTNAHRSPVEWIASSSVTHRRASSIPASSGREQSPLGPQHMHVRRDTAPDLINISEREHGPNSKPVLVPGAKNKELARVAGQAAPTKRQRSPYVKWSREEDEMLAQAVAKYGQKWDLVQKALPSRGYHQVRQRWLRKLGVFDSKPDLSSFQTSSFSSGARPPNGESGSPIPSEPPPNPKLGLAPLSSELAFVTFNSRGPSIREAS